VTPHSNEATRRPSVVAIGPYLYDLFWQPDFFAGLTGALIGFVAIALSSELRRKGTEALLVEGGLGVAVLAVALTALAILVSFLGDDYLVILERGSGGVNGAFFPYKAVAVLSCAGTLIAFVSAFGWTLAPIWLQATAFATSSLFNLWALVGTGQLVFITADHGKDRADLMRQMRESEAVIRARVRPVPSQQAEAEIARPSEHLGRKTSSR